MKHFGGESHKISGEAPTNFSDIYQKSKKGGGGTNKNLRESTGNSGDVSQNSGKAIKNHGVSIQKYI
jgi:hypothetical protein